MARLRTMTKLAVALVLASALTVGTVAIEDARPAQAASLPVVPVMGPNILNADQIAAWYHSKHKQFNVPGISARDLAQLFIWESAAENVRGDIAWAQSIVETGWFGYVGSIVQPHNWNFAGMGACDSCNSGTQFPSPRSGVRVQIQDLRNYADPHSRASNLAHPPVPEWYARGVTDPGRIASVAAHNFDTFFRKGLAPTWNQMGNGNHATSPHYGPAVINMYIDMLRFNGLPAEAAMGADPFGNLENLRRVPNGVLARGWTVDPSNSGSTPVDVYVNGIGVARLMADGHRPDVGAAYTAAGPNHGFDAVLPIRGGIVCVYAINIGTGVRNPSLGCRALPGPNPSANLEALRRRPAGLTLRGWVVDPDSARPANVDVYADGVGVARIRANTRRPDVAWEFPGYGPNHGFAATLPGVGGRVCVYAINRGFGNGNPLLGCRNVPRASPSGSLDVATRDPYGVRVRGWALDGDARAPISVDLYANGVGYARVLADGNRPDVGKAAPGYGNAHGFEATIPVAGGTVCAYGINTGPGGNTLLGCKNV